MLINQIYGIMTGLGTIDRMKLKKGQHISSQPTPIRHVLGSSPSIIDLLLPTTVVYDEGMFRDVYGFESHSMFKKLKKLTDGGDKKGGGKKGRKNKRKKSKKKNKDRKKSGKMKGKRSYKQQEDDYYEEEDDEEYLIDEEEGLLDTEEAEYQDQSKENDELFSHSDEEEP